jgi:hypothetical protein
MHAECCRSEHLLSGGQCSSISFECANAGHAGTQEDGSHEMMAVSSLEASEKPKDGRQHFDAALTNGKTRQSGREVGIILRQGNLSAGSVARSHKSGNLSLWISASRETDQKNRKKKTMGKCQRPRTSWLPVHFMGPPALRILAAK